MKACIYNPNKKNEACLEPIEIDKPKPCSDSALVKMLGVGVCGSDLLKLDRALIKPGTILGHELVGEIVEISDESSKKYNLKVGDRIVSSHHVPCLKCDFCLRGKESLCDQFKATNFNPGAFCEYIELSAGHLKHTVQKVPEHLSNLEASFTEPVACCIKAVRHSDSHSKLPAAIRHCEAAQQPWQSRYLVIGLGSIGLIIGQLLKYYYPNDIITGIDLNEERLKLALKLGFTNTSAQQESYDDIYLCAGANSTVELALKHARNGATITVFSSTPAETSFPNNEIYYKELTIKGSYSPNLEDLKEALVLLSSKKILVSDLISHKTNLDNLGKTIHQAKQERGIKVFLEN